MSEYSSMLNKLILANQAYAAGNPFLTDDEYHTLWRSIHELNPTEDHLYHTSRDPQLDPSTRPHKCKIMGTQKAFETSDLKPFIHRFGHKPWVLEPKYDGCACIFYTSPPGHSHPYLAILEGDSLKGRDVSHHTKFFTYTSEPAIPMDSCELVIPNSHWDESFGKNPRNTCAGWINSGNKPSQYPNIIHVVSHTHGPLSHELSLPSELSLSEMEDLLLRLYSDWKAIYPIDGIMIKLASQMDRLQASHNGVISNWSVAWKPPIQVGQTTIRDIEWNVSRHGKVVPTLIYDPIPLCGTTNTRVTGNNYDWISQRKYGINAKVLIGKAGEIIPKLIKPIEPGIVQMPEFCPVCGSPLSYDSPHMICDSESCIARLVQRLHWFYGTNTMDVHSIGEVMLEKLLNIPEMYHKLRDKPWILLDPYHNELIPHCVSAWGQAKTDIYLESLTSVNGSKTAVNFIHALGYPKLGYRTTLTLYQQLMGHKMRSRIQKVAMVNFVHALNDLKAAQQDLPNFKFAPVPQAPKLLYVITGTLSMPRHEIQEHLAKYGWQMTDTVTAMTALLIVGDLSKESRKYQTAKKLGKPIIQEYDLPKWLEHFQTHKSPHEEDHTNESPEPPS